MKKNVLILSAGRRVELVEAFQAELRNLVPEGKVFATDLRPGLSSACLVSDGAFEAPRVTDPDYCDFLVELCVSQDIGLVVPTIDTELLALSQSVSKFANCGIHLIISETELVEKCRDKRQTAALLDQAGIASPRIYDRNNLTFPCFAKPFDGSCSVGAIAINSRENLTEEQINNPKMMFAELICKDYPEYTVDAYYNRSGKLCCIVPRERIEVRGGEVSKGVTRKNALYDYLLPKLKEIKGARGCLTFQFFAKVDTAQFLAIEINPRFGGGFPLAYAAGANYPAWLICEYLLGDEINFFDEWKSDLLMLRYDAKIISYDYRPT